VVAGILLHKHLQTINSDLYVEESISWSQWELGLVGVGRIFIHMWDGLSTESMDMHLR
jgi:hypothetical protein